MLKTRNIARIKFGKNYFEIYVKCKIETLGKRDTKKLYAKAKKNIIKNLIGYNSNIKYEMSRYKKITNVPSIKKDMMVQSERKNFPCLNLTRDMPAGTWGAEGD